MQEEMENWKQLAVAREKDLVEAQLQRDLFAAQLPSGPNEGGPQDEILNELMAKLGERINSIKDYKELSRTQLEYDLSNALRQLDQMRVRFENAEAARKALHEKYKNVLEKADGTLASPLRRLNLTFPTTGQRKTGNLNSAAQKKKEKRQILCTPKNGAGPASRTFIPVLFDDSTEENTAPEPQNLEQDEEMAEERTLLRLEMVNNHLSQTVTEKEAQLESLSQKQKEQAKVWLEEKQVLRESESALKAKVEQLSLENHGLREKLITETSRNDVLSRRIYSANDEVCALSE
ncbi:unnamed protein product [Cylicostephanus goldi]|uniref:Uncharacterized protein n=1 Tax=Cylicostephanus goldi TaxID=71465 RepID=A0A3P7QE76_CYLGO|nr:unnamed protein product [Cylicostephanus goldi]